MRDLTEQLRRYGEAVERQAVARRSPARPAPAAPAPLPSPWWRRSSWMVAAAVVAAVLLVTAVVQAVRGGDPLTVATSPNAADQVFSTPTKAVVLFSDGVDGVLAVDLDRRVAARLVLPGERAGDQPFRLTVTDHTLVVGWGEIHAVPLTLAGARPVAHATVYVPAAEPGRVWAVDGSRGELRLVDLDGKVVLRSRLEGLDWHQVVIGVPGGLAVRTPDGISVWDATTRSVTQSGRSGQPADGAASDGRRLVWCTDSCRTVHSLDLARTGGPTPPHVTGTRAPVVTADGALAAAVEPDGTVALWDRRGTRTVVATGLDPLGSVQWGPGNGSDELFYASPSYGRAATVVGRWVPGDGRWEQHELPLGGGNGFVVLTQQETGPFFPRALGAAEGCPPPSVFPSGRGGTCGFRF